MSGTTNVVFLMGVSLYRVMASPEPTVDQVLHLPPECWSSGLCYHIQATSSGSQDDASCCFEL